MVSWLASCFTYETTKSVVVKSWTLGVINRIVQLLIIAYFVGWVFLHEKAYQVKDTAIESSVMTKVKGSGVYNDRIMDIADLITPSQGTSVFCIITRLITTENQVQTHCPNAEPKFGCAADEDCRKYANQSGENGVMTGRCVHSSNSSGSYCEIRGWCPIENGSVLVSHIKEVEDFTIFIKNSIRFPLFNFSKGNMLPNITRGYIKRCKFDMQEHIYCPIFKVGDILRYANQSFSNIAQEGGVIGVKIGWICDLDRSQEHCNPTYAFSRLDAVSQENNVSKGYNFRYAKYYKLENGMEYRSLFKAYAIRFDIIIYGNAGKFSVIPTLITMVAAFTSIGLGTVLCDIILLNFLKGAEQYKARKFEEVSDHRANSTVSEKNELYRGSCDSLSVKEEEKKAITWPSTTDSTIV